MIISFFGGNAAGIPTAAEATIPARYGESDGRFENLLLPSPTSRVCPPATFLGELTPVVKIRAAEWGPRMHACLKQYQVLFSATDFERRNDMRVAVTCGHASVWPHSVD